ncbi:MAG: hypothetical protein GY861_03065 [bacterium]|nr:hypothetical protein [bacterium]
MEKSAETILFQALAYSKLKGVRGLLPVEQKYAMTECYTCKHMTDVIGNTHIECLKPDINMIGASHGIRMGWFMYPFLFDPTWKMKPCDNFESVEAVNHSVSGTVSVETAQPNDK